MKYFLIILKIIFILSIDGFSQGQAQSANTSTVLKTLKALEKPLELDTGKPGEGEDFESSDTSKWRNAWRETPVWGGRIAYIDNLNNLFVSTILDGGSRSAWLLLARNVKDFQLMDWRVGVLKSDGRLMFAEGPIDTRLRLIARDVTSFQMTLTRIGFLNASGQLFIKEHGYKAALIADYVKAYQVQLDKIGVLRNDGELYIHKGGFVNALTCVAINIKRFQLEREWVGVLDDSGLRIATIQDSELKFSTVAPSVVDFEMEVSVILGEQSTSTLHIAIIDAAGVASIGESVDFTVAFKRVRERVNTVNWAGRQLITSNTEGAIWADRLHDDSTGVLESHLIGNATKLSANQEGSILLSRSARSISIMQSDSNRPKLPLSTALSRQDPNASPSNIENNQETEIMNGGLPGEGVHKIQISSIRPSFTRRPIGN